MDTFTPWTLFVDVGIISLLLLIGKLMRVKIKWIQKLFIPPQPPGRLHRIGTGSSRIRRASLIHTNGNIRRHLDCLHFRSFAVDLTESARKQRRDRFHVELFTSRPPASMGIRRIVGLAGAQPNLAIESGFRHYDAQRILWRTWHSCRHRTSLRATGT